MHRLNIQQSFWIGLHFRSISLAHVVLFLPLCVYQSYYYYFFMSDIKIMIQVVVCV